MTSTVEQLALQAGAAKFYPEAQNVHEQNYVVSGGFLQRFHDLVCEDDAKACEEIESARWALYKGLAPNTGQEPERGSDFVQGQSDGALLCAAAIRAKKVSA